MLIRAYLPLLYLAFFSRPSSTMRSYSGLPDDILYELCITAAYTKSQRKLSSVNKRTRLVATPILFRNVQYCAIGGNPLWEFLLEKIEVLRSSNEISFAVRYVN